MARQRTLALGVMLAAGVALAQTSPDYSPPPLVPAGAETSSGDANALPPPPPMPAPSTTPAQGTPPPPSLTPSATSGWGPGSPYGQPPVEKPGAEVGLMVSESLFGMLTSAGITLLPYFLLFNNGIFGDPTISSVMLVLIFATVPLAVAQTQVSLANGSRYYISETWPTALAGLGAQAAVLGLFYWTGWLGVPQASGGTPSAGGSEVLLLVGSIAAVPLVQMAVLNLTKSPRFKPVTLGGGKPGHGVTLGLPTPTPVLAETTAGRSVGLSLSLLNGTF